MNQIILFDVDGTLTEPRKLITTKMINVLQNINKLPNIDIGFVGGSDLVKQYEQLGEENLHLFTWMFAENGLMAYHKGELIHKKSILDELGENNYQKLINICLLVLAEMEEIPKKRGNFIELRNGMINISPIGRSCTQAERDEFYEWDKIHHCRDKIIERIQYHIRNQNLYVDLNFSIGGQISIDIFPVGWDKTYCLQFVENKYDYIYFFGDKTHIGGNDFEIYNDYRVKGYSVSEYLDTIDLLTNKFLL